MIWLVRKVCIGNPRMRRLDRNAWGRTSGGIGCTLDAAHLPTETRTEHAHHA
jgi:hypothetical protein